jgi:phosphatidylglycerophosphate synthase
MAGLVALRRRWWWVTAVYTITILLFGLLLAGVGLDVWRWMGPTAVAALYCLWVVWRHLDENRRDGETAVLPTFGWGNRLTLLRGLCMSLMSGFLLLPWPAGWLAWLPALLYTVAAVADYLDGYAARKTNHMTLLGGRLDMAYDGLGVMLVTLLAVWYGQLPWWYLLIGLAMYFFLAGLWLRRRWGLPVYEMSFSWHRRIFAGFQMAFMSVVLWPIIPAWGATVAGTMFALASTASFGRDWLVVIGWLQPETAVYQRWQRRVYVVTAVWLPLVARLLFVVSVWLMYPFVYRAQVAALFAGWGMPASGALAQFWAVMGVLTGGMVVLGIAGRLAAWVLLLPLGFFMIAQGPTWVSGVALVCVLYVLMLGSGAGSLWRPEEKWMTRRAGG